MAGILVTASIGSGFAIIRWALPRWIEHMNRPFSTRTPFHSCPMKRDHARRSCSMEASSEATSRISPEESVHFKQLGILLFLRLVPEGLKGFELWDETQTVMTLRSVSRSGKSCLPAWIFLSLTSVSVSWHMRQRRQNVSITLTLVQSTFSLACFAKQIVSQPRSCACMA